MKRSHVEDSLWDSSAIQKRDAAELTKFSVRISDRCKAWVLSEKERPSQLRLDLLEGERVCFCGSFWMIVEEGCIMCYGKRLERGNEVFMASPLWQTSNILAFSAMTDCRVLLKEDKTSCGTNYVPNECQSPMDITNALTTAIIVSVLLILTTSSSKTCRCQTMKYFLKASFPTVGINQ